MKSRGKERIYTEAIGCYVSAEVKEQLEMLAIKRNITLSDLFRELIDKALSKFEREFI